MIAAESKAIVLATQGGAFRSDERGREEEEEVEGVGAHGWCFDMGRWQLTANKLLELELASFECDLNEQESLVLVARNGAMVRKARHGVIIMLGEQKSVVKNRWVRGRG